MEKRLGNYVLREQLGEGAFGVVWLAEHVLFGGSFAIKILSQELLVRYDRNVQADLVAKFYTEARVLHALNHPHIVTVSDGGLAEDGRNYFVMEAVQGESLRARISRGRLEPDDAIAIIGQFALALAAAHHEGIIHRDLKPENMMITQREGRDFAKLLDFGVARLTSDVARQMAPSGYQPTRGFSGTPLYMPPEQWKQPVKYHGFEVGPHSDVYALGCVLYELVTGRTPFVGEGPDTTIAVVMDKHFNEKPVAPRVRNPRVPLALDALILKTLEKRPDDRYRTMDELLQGLGIDPAGQPSKATFDAQLALLAATPDSPDKEQALRDLAGKNPRRPEAHAAVAAFYNKAHRFDKSVAVLRAAVEALPQSGELQQLLGMALIQSGKRSEARQVFLGALRLGLDEKVRHTVEALLKQLESQAS